MTASEIPQDFLVSRWVGKMSWLVGWWGGGRRIIAVLQVEVTKLTRSFVFPINCMIHMKNGYHGRHSDSCALL